MPIAEMLSRYARQNNARFHMPGHKGGVDGFDFSDLFDGVFPYDITELDFSDNLMNPVGVIAEAQDLYAEAYGARQCFFTTNGSTCGVLAMVFAAQGDILAERASHISVFNALRTAKRRAYVVNNGVADGKFTPVSAEQISRCLLLHPQIKSVVITSPNYYGECADIKAIYGVCKSRGVKLFVDGAHGAHFAFSPLLPDSVAMHCDACVVSTHKTLPAMTQTAAVFANDDALAKKIKGLLAVFNSSSPNYVLMASMDFARAYMQRQVADGADRRTSEFVRCIKQKHRFLTNDDFTRLVLSDTDGQKAYRHLMQKGVYAEFCDSSRVIFILSLAEKAENLSRLQEALLAMPSFDKKSQSFDFGGDGVCSQVDFTFDGGIEEVPIEEAEGRICAEQCGVYPPCIPLFLQNEKIKNAAYLKNFDSLFGVRDGKIKVYDI